MHCEISDYISNEYLKESDKEHTAETKQHVLDLVTYYRKIDLSCIFTNSKQNLSTNKISQ